MIKIFKVFQISLNFLSSSSKLADESNSSQELMLPPGVSSMEELQGFSKSLKRSNSHESTTTTNSEQGTNKPMEKKKAKKTAVASVLPPKPPGPPPAWAFKNNLSVDKSDPIST